MFRNNNLFKKAQEALKARNGGVAVGSVLGLDDDYPLVSAELTFPITVKMSVKIVKILNVDTSSNTFFCDFILTCKWEDQSFRPVVEGLVLKESVDMTRHFIPEYDITNLVSLTDGTVIDPVFDFYRRKDSNVVRVIMKQRFRGTFFEHFELAQFPFDCQSLSVNFRARQDTSKVVFRLASKTKYPSVFSGSRFKMAEWDYLSPKGTPFVKCEDASRSKGAAKPHSFFSFNQPVSRKMGYYLANVVPLYFVIVAFGWLGFANAPEDNANRFNALIALLLTSTAFKYVYKETLPRVHYLTRLDYYMYLQLSFLLAQGVLHALASLALEFDYLTVSDIRYKELQALIIMATVWILGHFVLVNWAKGHRGLLDLEADELLHHLDELERQDQRAEKRRKRGLFQWCWWKKTRNRARSASGSGENSSLNQVTDTERSRNDSARFCDEYGLDDYELGALFELGDAEDWDYDTDSQLSLIERQGGGGGGSGGATPTAPTTPKSKDSGKAAGGGGWFGGGGGTGVDVEIAEKKKEKKSDSAI
ncbi:hypothetical protein TL16_g09732 [Triparma laevis f. inornata]|uniref:Uncharacterized protein n=2 Tax=Triparma laevis TaxID=1534972 RepID=A0A9W7EKA3_9STRA|nr:hypothetical protein TrLO_g15214 [Triparma laevis f. longispina]GMH83843.1 hypothetical protein TL16_g09732 [Triparma laevis f. inornata]